MPDIPCPHCGRENEEEREVCWACCKLLKPAEAKPAEAPAEKFEIPGSIPMPPMPESLSSGPGIVSRTMNAKITVNGKEYERLEDVPEPFRSKLKEGMAQAKPVVVNYAPSGISTFKLGPFTFRSYGTFINEPLDLDPDAPAAPPDGFRFDQNGPERRVSWRWISWDSAIGIYFAAIIGVLFAFMLYIYLHSPADKPWPSQAMAMLWLFGLPPAAIAYTWLCYLVNRTTLRVDAARASVRHGPLPCWGAKDVLKGDIARVFSEKRIDTRNDGSGGAMFAPKATYEVKLLLKGGKTIKLVSGLLAPEQAMFIEQQIRRA